jgi:hypothetical protein
MRDNDGWKLSKAAREQLRITAVKRVLAGESPEEAIRSTGFNHRHLSVAGGIPQRGF